MQRGVAHPRWAQVAWLMGQGGGDAPASLDAVYKECMQTEIAQRVRCFRHYRHLFAAHAVFH